jgi:hypothetical protein
MQKIDLNDDGEPMEEDDHIEGEEREDSDEDELMRDEEEDVEGDEEEQEDAEEQDELYDMHNPPLPGTPAAVST